VLREAAAGSGGKPSIPSQVKLRCVGRLASDGRRFESGVSAAALGEGVLIRGLERGVLTMQRGEVATFVLRAEYAYGLQGKPAGGPGLADVPGGASVVYEVELISWEAPRREAWEMSLEERLDEALRLKEAGGREFGTGAWREAQALYHSGAQMLLDEAPVDGYDSLGELRAPKGKEAEARALLVACRLNEVTIAPLHRSARSAQPSPAWAPRPSHHHALMAQTLAEHLFLLLQAACALKRDEWSTCVECCAAVLARLTDPLGLEAEANVKALFRRGRALAKLAEFERARADVREAARLAPANREVRALWEELRSLESVQRASGRVVLAKMATAGLYKGLHLRPKRRNTRPHVWMDVSIGGRHAGRVTFELFAEALPKTCHNFRALCTGERGLSARTGKPLCYRGSRFHRAVNVDDEPPQYLREGGDGSGRQFEIWKGMFVQGGDIVDGDGTGNESVYGEAFEDEGFEFKHNDKYLLSMAGTPPMRHREAEARAHAPHRNGSQFFVTTKSTTQNLGGASITHFDYRHVVFGRVSSREGVRVVNLIQKLPTDTARGHRIREAVVITNCGEVPLEEEAADATDATEGEEGGGPRAKPWFEEAAEAEAEAARAAEAPRPVPVVDPEDQTRSAEVDD